MTGSTTTLVAKTLQVAFAASDGVYGYLGPNWTPNTTDPAYGTSIGGFFRWRLWPGPAITSGQGATGGNSYLGPTALLSSTSSPTQTCGSMLIATPFGSVTPVVATAFTQVSQATTSAITIAVQGSSPAATEVSLGGHSVDFIN